MPQEPEELNCTIPKHQHAIPFDADPDIAGIGVIVAFLIPACVSFVLASFMFLISSDAAFVVKSSFLDYIIRRPIQKWAGHWHRKAWMEVLRETVTMFSDQQLVVATSLQIVTFSRHIQITQYHATVVVYLVWIAASTHQICLLAIQDRLLERTGMRIWRLVWMLLLELMLIPTTVLIWGSSWLVKFGLSSDCGWRDFGKIDPGEDQFVLAFNLFTSVWSIVYLLNLLLPSWLFKRLLPVEIMIRYIKALSGFFVGLFDRTNRRLAKTSSELLAVSQGTPVDTYGIPALLYITRLALEVCLLTPLLNLERVIMVIAFSLWEIVASNVFEFARALLQVIMFTIWLDEIRQKAPHKGLEGDEDKWGFGQILPILMLILPVFAIFDFVAKQSGG